MRKRLREIVYKSAPRPALDAYIAFRMRRRARSLAALGERGGPEVWLDELLSCHFFRPLQKRAEILRLAEIVREMRPRAVCEIGAAGGGTAFIFAQTSADDAEIVSIDLAFHAERRRAVGGFARSGQRIHCVEGDSHDGATLERVRGILNGRALDILYLDGDHSYEGVTRDFRMYAPLVRRGGLIAFHDITPDFRTRYGVETRSSTGGVPRFWRELKAKGERTQEIVEDTEQDGYGIGLLHWAGEGSAEERAREDFAEGGTHGDSVDSLREASG